MTMKLADYTFLHENAHARGSELSLEKKPAPAQVPGGVCWGSPRTDLLGRPFGLGWLGRGHLSRSESSEDFRGKQ